MKGRPGSNEPLPPDGYVDDRAPLIPEAMTVALDEHNRLTWPTGSRTESNLNSAQIAWITAQKPARIIVHANEMTPEGVCKPQNENGSR